MRSRLLGGQREGKMNSGVSRSSSWTVSWALCANALSCWKWNA